MTKYDELFNNLNFKQESNQDLSKTYAGLILEFKDNLEEVKSIQRLRYLLVDFKDKNCSKLLFNYFKKQEYDFEGYENLGLTEINLFHPYKMEIEIQSTNAGLFTSIISIETLILYYKKHIMKSNFDLNQFFLTGDRQDNVEEGVQNIENNNEINRTYVEYLLYLFDKEISEIITKSANIYGTVSALNHLVRISNLFAVLEGSKEKFEFKLNKNLNNVSIHCLITKLKFRIIQIIILIASNFSLQNFHPFILLRLRQIIDIYFFDILKFYSKNERHYNSFNNHLDYNTYAELRENFCAEFNINSEFEIYKIVYLWEEIYYMAKLELYRQISLYNVGDMAHFDHKRLLYALITVMTKPIQYKSNKIRSIFKDKFNYPEERYSGPYSNTLIRDYALNILFDKKSNGMDIWGVGELLKDGISRYSIQTVECLIDLLTCKLLKNALIPYRNHLKHFYDWIASSLEVNEEGIPVGWAKDHERSRNPAGFVTAMTLQFIRVFCKFLSFTSDSLARKFFNRNIIENDKLNAIKWDKIIDSYGFKWKFYLLQQDGYINTDLLPYRKNTAIIYGPPGTGKTTSVKAFAKKIGWDFLELQPADFLFEGEDSILNRLYLVFENLNVIRKAVIFIDEVEEFIVDRTGDHVEHRNILFTNFLLPKIQEINEKNESILILSTNDISKVDNAIKRINRIDLLIPISKPTIVGRLQLLVNYIENKDGYDQFV
ncbi:MAG: ATP-binding protein, partial [Candidatus Heimdallarchaeota archaeon]|nr:ATP-binding protein [Candidatus Heimdallarchaeota archaeon]